MMTRGSAYAAVLVALVVGYYLLHKHDRKADHQIAATVLGPHEVEKVVIDPARHTISFASKRGIQTSVRAAYLPPHTTAISIDDKGAIRYESRTYGTETSPFAGFALGTDIKARAALGLNLFYAHRWEFGGGLLLDNEVRDTRLFVGVGYNVYSNCSVGVAIDNRKTAHLVASLRI